MSLQLPRLEIRKRKSAEMMDEESMEAHTMERAAEVSATTHQHWDIKEILSQHRIQPKKDWVQRQSATRKHYWCCRCSKEGTFVMNDKQERVCKLCSHHHCGECADSGDQYPRKRYWCCICCKKAPVKKAKSGGGICEVCAHWRCGECLIGNNEESVE